MSTKYLELRGRIRAKGWTIADMARKVGLSGSHLSNILCGRTSPQLSLCYDIIREVGADPSEIYKLFPPGGIAPDHTLGGRNQLSREVIHVGRK
jgi:transcriptional regulator with XRE-family HTH domain